MMHKWMVSSIAIPIAIAAMVIVIKSKGIFAYPITAKINKVQIILGISATSAIDSRLNNAHITNSKTMYTMPKVKI